MSSRAALPAMAVFALLVAAHASAADLPTGQIIDRVSCAADPSHGYALYLPSNYTPTRTWPVLFAFDPGARGRVPVERFQAAAERFGFIVAGSHNSRNGAMDFARTLALLTNDVAARVAVDPKRVYLAGMSGGARTALGVALASPSIAGVIASSAGYPDTKVRTTLAFPLFATAGTEDFNHLEMRRLDRALTSPHRLVIFNGGHVWLSSDLAMDALAYMELHAMRAGLKPRDTAEIDRQFALRTEAAAGAAGIDAHRRWQAIAEDFKDLRDVSEPARKAAELARDKAVRAALDRERDEDRREEALLRDFESLARLLASDERRTALNQLRQRLSELSTRARAQDDSPERQMARRVLSAVRADGTNDAEYRKLLAEFRFTP